MISTHFDEIYLRFRQFWRRKNLYKHSQHNRRIIVICVIDWIFLMIYTESTEFFRIFHACVFSPFIEWNSKSWLLLSLCGFIIVQHGFVRRIREVRPHTAHILGSSWNMLASRIPRRETMLPKQLITCSCLNRSFKFCFDQTRHLQSIV